MRSCASTRSGDGTSPIKTGATDTAWCCSGRMGRAIATRRKPSPHRCGRCPAFRACKSRFTRTRNPSTTPCRPAAFVLPSSTHLTCKPAAPGARCCARISSPARRDRYRARLSVHRQRVGKGARCRARKLRSAPLPTLPPVAKRTTIPSEGVTMKIVGFEANGAPHLGVVEGDQVIDLQAVDKTIPGDLGECLRRNNGDLSPLKDAAKRAPAGARRPIKGLTYGLPVAAPGKVICLGLNYLEHVKEGSQRDNIPKFPTIFMRGLTSLVPHGAPIIRPQASETLDYEAELILVVGKRGKHLTAANATSCIAGYSCANEGSVREFQRKTTQWDMGKNFDRTGGFGPWLVTADELPDAAKGLKIQSRLNGTVMQSDNTDNMMFPIIEMLVYLTQGITLEPGDVIFTGTPSGVGHARKPPVWMKNGDTIEVEIERIGTLRHPIADEKL